MRLKFADNEIAGAVLSRTLDGTGKSSEGRGRAAG